MKYILIAYSTCFDYFLDRWKSVKAFQLLLGCMLILTLGSPKYVHAEVPFSIRYTTDNGLLSNIIYEVAQDHNGYIWLATELGISRFDGKQFTNFTKHDGLTDNVCLSLLVDNDNRIWVGLLNGEYCYIEQGKIYNKYNSAFIRKLNQLKTIGHFSQNKKGEIVFRGNNNHYVLHFKQESIETLPHNNESDFYFLGYENNQFHSPDIYITPQSNEKYKIEMNKYSGVIAGRRFADVQQQISTFLCGNKIVQLRSEGVTQNSFFEKMQIEVQGFFRTENDFIYLTNKGIYTLPAQQINQQPSLWIDVSNANHLFVDSENFIWISTQGSGLIKIPDRKIRLIPIKEGCFRVSASDSNTISLGTTNGILKMYKPQHHVLTEYASVDLFSLIRNITVCKQFIYVLTKNNLFRINIHTHQKQTLLNNSSLKSLLVVNDTSIYVSSRIALYKVKNDQLEELIKFPKLNRIYGIAKEPDGSFLLGTEQGLLYVQNNHTIDTLIHDKVNMIAPIGSNLLACATESEGVFLVQQHRIISSFKPQTKKDFICNSINYDAYRHQVYAGTTEGLYVFNIENNKLQFVKQIGEEYGLLNTQIQDISFSKQTIFLAIHSGILMLEKDMHEKEEKLYSMQLKSLKVNGNEIDLQQQNTTQFEKGTHTVQFKAQAVSFGDHQKLQYLFYLKDTEHDTAYSSDGKITYANLKPGLYHMVILARNSNLHGNSIQQTLDFYIPPFWWQTLSFKILIALLSGLSIFLLLNVIRKGANNKMKNKNLLLDMEIKALRSQMNPHFIFNSLNSAQEYIFNDKPEAANKYLSVFSKLVRMSLELSTKSVVSILDEYEYLALYLKLEKMKYEDKFNYTISIDEDIVPDYTFIPSMILQPVVENALVHGIMNKPSNGLVQIRFYKTHNHIICSVEDDGIGREASLKNKTQGKLSISTNNIIQRIQLINQGAQANKISYKIIDKHNQNNHACGTIFELKIPLNFQQK